MLLLARARQSATVALLAFSNAFVVVALMMTGTRSALVALWLLLLVVLPLAAWRSRAALPAAQWPMPVRWIAAVIAVGTVLGLGSIPSGNAKILGEERGRTAIERALTRTASISPDDRSLGLRRVMWAATGRMIQDHPLTGVGAGAWEVHVPPYLPEGEQIETDYYVHNEVLQLLSEDGLVGALFLAGLIAWLLRAAWRTWQASKGEDVEEASWRAVLLASLLALLLVCNAGFPWRLASTGALFALLVGALAASDDRLGLRGRAAAATLPWRRERSGAVLAGTAACLALATYISAQAVACEGRIVRAAQIALQITHSGRPNDPRWAPAKQQMLQLTREAVAINPHYRKITPMVADELARWGDWKDATWIWESVLSSRPEIPAILANAARGHAVQGEWDQAQQLLDRAKRLAPEAPSVLSLEVIVLSRTGHEAEALDVARRALAKGRYDVDLLNAAFLLGWRAGDLPFAEAAILKRVEEFPAMRVQALVDLGGFYAGAMHDDRRALLAWSEALRLAGPQQRDAVLARVPAGYRDRL
nr:O-antigen ligase family protein [Ramlibacter algicola]